MLIESAGTWQARATARASHDAQRQAHSRIVVALIAFLTLVDLFAAQALLPALVQIYGVSPDVMGTAVNASTLGMALSGLLVGCFAPRLDRRRGATVALALLALPTALLAAAPGIASFTALRIAQGALMAAAFALTLAFLTEESGPGERAAAIAAYITGNVASNLVGRLIATAVADTWGVTVSFLVLAGLNLAGAALVFATLRGMRAQAAPEAPTRSPFAALREDLADPALRALLAIGFAILFAFIGTFSYVNFVLVRPPHHLGMMSLGLVYLVFLPSIATTPLAGRLATRIGPRAAVLTGLGVATTALPLLLSARLAVVLLGLALLAVGTFLAQAVATASVGRIAKADPAAAGSLYLACYFLGGIIGSALLGRVFVAFGWEACVVGIAASLLTACALAGRLR